MRILLSILILLSLCTNAFALKNSLNGFPGPEIDIRAYGAVCNNNSSDDDGPAFDAAYDALTSNGGTIVIPAGKTCYVGGDVNVESNVRLKCQPGGTIKAISGEAFILGLLQWLDGGSLANDSPVEGCNFDLNGEHIPGIAVFGQRNSVTRSRFYGGDTSHSTSWNIVNYSCQGEGCKFSDNQITGGNTTGAKDVCLYTAGSTTAGNQTLVSGNNIKDCDTYGIQVGSGAFQISNNAVSSASAATSGVGIYMAGIGIVNGNHVTCAGSSSKCVEIATAQSSASNNRLTVSGTDAVGVKLSNSFTSANDNKIVVSSTSGIGIFTDSANTVINNNSWSLTSATGGTDDAVGIKVGDGDEVYDINTVVSGNVGGVTTSDSQVHIEVAGPLATITGNVLTAGKYCIAPSQESAQRNYAAFNVSVTGNRCYAPITSGVIAVAGWEVVANYIAWGTGTGGAAIELGDDRTYKVGTGGHVLIASNLLYWGQSGTPAIKANDIGKTCNGGTNWRQNCTNSDNTDCPSATCGNCCVQQDIYGVQVVGNHMFQVTESTGPGVDLASGVSATSGDIYNWIIDGNTFSMPPIGSTSAEASPGIECSSSNQSKVYDIVVGSNSYDGYKVTTGDTNEGRISLNCTPDMVQDIDSSFLWIPAAGCNGSSAYPMFDLPSSSAPTPTCYGSTINRGFLSYANAADTGGHITFSIPNTLSSLDSANSYQFFVRPVFTVGTSNSLYTRWGFSLQCNEAGSSVDAAWGSESTLDTQFGGTAYQFAIPSSYSTIGGTACTKPIISLRIRRIGTNSTTGQDDQTQATLLHGIQLWLRKQD